MNNIDPRFAAAHYQDGRDLMHTQDGGERVANGLRVYSYRDEELEAPAPDVWDTVLHGAAVVAIVVCALGAFAGIVWRFV